jgi:hypothetical protein
MMSLLILKIPSRVNLLQELLFAVPLVLQQFITTYAEYAGRSNQQAENAEPYFWIPLIFCSEIWVLLSPPAPLPPLPRSLVLQDVLLMGPQVQSYTLLPFLCSRFISKFLHTQTLHVNSEYVSPHCRSQWPCGLRHEQSSPAQTLGSWAWIPFEARMYVCVYSVFMLLCM